MAIFPSKWTRSKEIPCAGAWGPGGVLLEYLVQEKQAEQTIRARLPGCAHHPVHHREGDKGIEWLWWWWAGAVNVDDDDHPNFESVPASLPRTVPKKDNSTLDEGMAHIQETNFISWEVKGGCFPVYFYRIKFQSFSILETFLLYSHKLTKSVFLNSPVTKEILEIVHWKIKKIHCTWKKNKWI